MSRVYVALVHYPVKDRQGELITTAVTNLDVHDIARSCRTYGIDRYFVVTPIEAQRQLVARILEHWRSGAGAKRVPERTRALAICESANSLADVSDAIEALEGKPPTILVTGARPTAGQALLSYEKTREILRSPEDPTLILFGTGHGLALSSISGISGVIAPIEGGSDYNHLSVRAAVAITLDRLLGTCDA